MKETKPKRKKTTSKKKVFKSTRPVIVFDRQERPDHANSILNLVRAGKMKPPKIPTQPIPPKEVSFCRACASQSVVVYASGWWYCNECFSLRFVRCNGCNFPMDKALGFTSRDFGTRKEKVFCETCLNIFTHSCNGCGNSFFTENLVAVLNSTYYCGPCAERYTRKCHRCNRHVHRDRIVWDEDRDEYHCCNQCVQSANTNTHSDIIPWNAPVNLQTRGSGPPFYGIELEIECGEHRQQEVSRTISEWTAGWSCHKGDGSLSNGFEIVSCPASVPEHIKMWTPFLDNRPSYISSWQSGTCGMHIHITRSGLSQLQIAKMLVFLNSKQNEDFIKLVCGRYNTNYCRKTKFDQGLRKTTEKYSALNTSPRATVELRLFRGTLNKNSFFKNLEFAEALVVHTSPANTGLIDSIGTESFIRLVEKNSKRWPHLHAYLQS